jgi:hypothetical protein
LKLKSDHFESEIHIDRAELLFGRLGMGKEIEMTLTCRQCGKQFIFSESEQEFFQLKGFTLPTHCKECRFIRRSVPLVCSKCGTKLDNGSMATCLACTENVRLVSEEETQKHKLSLEEVSLKLSQIEAEKGQLASEMNEKLTAMESEKAQISREMEARIGAIETEKTRLMQEAENKLRDVESEKARLAVLVEQGKLEAAELEARLDTTKTELEKFVKYRADLDYLAPALNDISNSLAALGRNQEGIKQTLLQWTHDMTEQSHNGSTMDNFKRILRIGRKSTSPVN